MPAGKNWTDEEENQLSEMWGYYTIDTIARRLGRTPIAVRVKVQRLGLPPFLDSGDYVTLNKLLHCLYGTKKAYHDDQLESLVKNRGMPVHKKARSSRYSVRVVYLHEFWKWAEKNRSFLDFSNLEPGALGIEPSWLQQQRKHDGMMKIRIRKCEWTKLEDERLIHLVKEHKYTYAEMSRILNRTSGAIDHRLRVLNLKERPVAVCTSEQGATWTEEMLIYLADGIRNGCTYTAIGDRVGKSEKAVRGKVYSTYYTEKLDEVRAMLRDGAWGDNRPVPIVRKAMTISTFRSGIKRDIRKMTGILKHLEEIKRGERDGQHG